MQWEQAGKVEVAAGCVWVGDLLFDNPDREWVLSAAGALAAAQQVGRGVVVAAGTGDGTYDVFVRRVEVPGRGRCVAELRVVFIGDGPS